MLKLKRQSIILASIFILALSLRLWFIAGYSTALVADELSYDQLAVSILQGEGYVSQPGYPTAGRPPGYPLFLSAIYFLFGRNILVVRIIQAFIGTLLCILVYFLGKEMLGERIGILAGILSSVHLGFIAQSMRILTEGLAAFLLLIAMFFFYKAKQNYHKKMYCILTGFMIGIASLVRPNLAVVLFLIAFVLIYDLYKKAFGFKGIVRYLMIYGIAFLIPILPWTVRNYKVFHAFVPISTFQGIAFYTSYKPVDGKIYGFVRKDDITEEASRLPSETEASDFLTRETFNLIRNNPAIFFKLLGLKMAYFFSPFNWELIHNGVIYNYLYVFYFPFFLIGSFMLLRRFNKFSPLYLPILGIILTCAVFYGSPRFRLPVEPYMLLLSSAAIVHIYKRISRKKLFISFLSIFLLGNFLLYLNSFAVKQICRNFLENIGLW